MRGSRVLSRTITVVLIAAVVHAGQDAPGYTASGLSLRAVCATGSLSGRADGGSSVALGGWIEPCPGVLPGAMFDVVFYYPDLAVLAASHRYTALPARTPVAVAIDLDGPQGSRSDSGDLHAVCLALYMRHPSPVACVRIERTGSDQVEVGPIAGNDPLLAVTRWFDAGNISIPPDPHCGTCL